MKKYIIAVFLLLLSISLAVAVYIYLYLNSTINTKRLLFIPQGSTKSFVSYLKSKGYDVGDLDYYLIRYHGYPQAGWIDLNSTKLKREEFYYKVTHSKAVLQKVTIIPGETTEIFLKNIAKKLELNEKKILDYYSSSSFIKEGLLFADTYSVPKGIDEKELVDFLIKSSLKKHKNLSLKYLKDYNKTRWFFDIVTKASIIQKESANKDEMPIISAVIDNRIKKHMKLQMDGTLNYGKYSHIKVTPRRIKDDNTTYNTYKHFGMPKYPVCIVSTNAIKSAINPDKNEYLYFVLGDNKKHIFSKTYNEHKKAIRKSE